MIHVDARLLFVSWNITRDAQLREASWENAKYLVTFFEPLVFPERVTGYTTTLAYGASSSRKPKKQKTQRQAQQLLKLVPDILAFVIRLSICAQAFKSCRRLGPTLLA